MVRKSINSLFVLALSALALTSCGKEDVTDLTDEWTKAENEVTTELQAFTAKHGELNTKFQAMQTAADPADSAGAAKRAACDLKLKEHETAVADIQKELDAAKAGRDSAIATGARADVEAAWGAAKASYEGIKAKLSELKSQQSTIENDLNAPAAAAPADTTASAATADTAAKTAPAGDAAKTEGAAKK